MYSRPAIGPNEDNHRTQQIPARGPYALGNGQTGRGERCAAVNLLRMSLSSEADESLRMAFTRAT